MDILNVNHTVDYFVHAYGQAPWRIQRQWIGSFLLAVLGLAMVAALYLDVSAQAAIAGRQIQTVTADMIAVQHSNADLQTNLAELTSNNAMEQRAQAAGFQPVDPGQLQYIFVPGYAAPTPAILAGALTLKPSSPSIPPAYTESLIDWLNQSFHNSQAMGMIGVSQ